MGYIKIRKLISICSMLSKMGKKVNNLEENRMNREIRLATKIQIQIIIIIKIMKMLVMKNARNPQQTRNQHKNLNNKSTKQKHRNNTNRNSTKAHYSYHSVTT
jgi:hypothetical protein